MLLQSLIKARNFYVAIEFGLGWGFYVATESSRTWGFHVAT